MCVCVSVCVVRVHGCVSLHFPPFYFSCFVLFCFVFSIFVLVIFLSIFHDLKVHVFFSIVFSYFLSFSFFVFFILVIFHDLNVHVFFFCDFFTLNESSPSLPFCNFGNLAIAIQI